MAAMVLLTPKAAVKPIDLVAMLTWSAYQFRAPKEERGLNISVMPFFNSFGSGVVLAIPGPQFFGISIGGQLFPVFQVTGSYLGIAHNMYHVGLTENAAFCKVGGAGKYLNGFAFIEQYDEFVVGYIGGDLP